MNGFTWLLKIELPDRDILLNDGGITTWNGDTYRATDASVGSIASVSAITEGVGGEIPALEIDFKPPSSAAMTELTVGCFRQSPLTLYLAEYDKNTGAVVGTPEARWRGNLDKPRVAYALRELSINLEATPQLETMFFKDNGNGLSASFHKALYPGETGHDNATGLQISTYWGVAGGQATARAGGGSGAGGGSFGEFRVEFL